MPHRTPRILIIAAAISCACRGASSLAPPLTASRSPSDRRAAIREISSSFSAAFVAGGLSRPALAATSYVPPSAPLDALLPATRVRATIDRAVDLASKLASKEDDDDAAAKKEALLAELGKLLLEPQDYARGLPPIDVPQRPAKSYLDAYASYRNRVSILERPGAMLVQNGEIDAWKRLKRQERAREDADPIRAALNYYTSNLNFDPDKFAFTAKGEDRSRMIRADEVPDVKTVIASDMGLRYLLRNDVLTAMDDARSELEYLKKRSDGGGGAAIDGRDLLDLLVAARGALGKWFDLIDEGDVVAAADVVRREG